ncbi:MAG: four helix bundle protein [Thermodesulfobacteriota bacterium]
MTILCLILCVSSQFLAQEVILKFEDLEVWKKSLRLCAKLYKYFQSIKGFGFCDQIIRSALSILSNIAELKTNNSYLKYNIRGMTNDR